MDGKDTKIYSLKVKLIGLKLEQKHQNVVSHERIGCWI